MATGPGGGFSLSTLLDQYEGSGPKGLSSGPGPGPKSSITNGRNSNAQKDGGGPPSLRKDRPVPIDVPGRNLRVTDSKSNTVSPLNTFTPPISKALDATDDATEKKRKMEENGTGPDAKKARLFEGLTKEQKVAKLKLLKAKKAARDAARANASVPGKDGNGSGSAASNPNSPIVADAPRKPAKGSYAEIMERAKQLQAISSVPAKIIHKETKVEKKKVVKPEKPDVGKKPTTVTGKTQNGKSVISSGVSKPPQAKKPVGRPVGRPTASRPDDKKLAPAKPVESRPKVQQVEWKGTARPSAAAKPSSSKPASRPSEREKEREGDRSRGRSLEQERERSRFRSPVKRYHYAESEEDEYYSSDDMEATGADILDEEDFSRQVGFREDIEAERLERELAAKKAKKNIRR